MRYRCGNEYSHQNACPAMKIECNKCHKVRHFAKCCKSKSTFTKRKKMCLVHGKNKREHDKSLELVLKRLNFKGATLNKQKCQLDMCSINQGLWLILRKLELSKVLKHLHQQKKFVVYWEQQIMFPGLFLTILVEPMRRLTSKNTSWVWKRSTYKIKEGFDK